MACLIRQRSLYPDLMSLFWSIAERRIQEALDAGDLDVPAGAEIRGLDQPYDPMWWVKAWIEREGIDLRQRFGANPAG